MILETISTTKIDLRLIQIGISKPKYYIEWKAKDATIYSNQMEKASKSIFLTRLRMIRMYKASVNGTEISSKQTDNHSLKD